MRSNQTPQCNSRGNLGRSVIGEDSEQRYRGKPASAGCRRQVCNFLYRGIIWCGRAEREFMRSFKEQPDEATPIGVGLYHLDTACHFRNSRDTHRVIVPLVVSPMVRMVRSDAHPCCRDAPVEIRPESFG